MESGKLKEKTLQGMVTGKTVISGAQVAPFADSAFSAVGLNSYDGFRFCIFLWLYLKNSTATRLLKCDRNCQINLPAAPSVVLLPSGKAGKIIHHDIRN